jgi:hypothetical protein
VLRGIDAVYYALTLPNAKFEFGASAEPLERTINQPWTQVVLEGLRRLDEGIIPLNAFPDDYTDNSEAPVASEQETSFEELESLRVPSFLSFIGKESMAKKKFVIAAAVVVAVAASIAAIGVPRGWYGRAKTAAAVSQAESTAVATEPSLPAASEVPSTEVTPSENPQPAEHNDEAELAAKRQREKEKAKAREEKSASALNAAGSSTPAAPIVVNEAGKPGAKRISVTVSYDESGRVTQASGADAGAIRIARQKRFPAGKAGSATITIPIN